MRVKMIIEVEIDDEAFAPYDDENRFWIENEILVGNGSLVLHSNEIGDTVGDILKVSDIVWPLDLKQNTP
jgi:hypothetical protein